ncbi:MAG TPA: bifunctional UDP-N-acetylglucosamine diphosphorylase/glucosamine-1-phosphate N-acetyltransferase GlmU [Erysipelothrix sp.]
MNYAIVLAAGKGTRMKSDKNKVMHDLMGKPMIGHLVDHLEEIDLDEIVVVTGYQKEAVEEYLKGRVSFAYQGDQIGTGNAVAQVEQLKNKKGSTLVVLGDCALLQPQTLQEVFAAHEGYDLTLTTAIVEEPKTYSRIIRDSQGRIDRVSDYRDSSELEKTSKEINLGVYCFDNELLFHYLPKIEEIEGKDELNIIDLVKIMKEDNRKIQALKVEDAREFMGVNDRVQLSTAHKWMRKIINQKHLDKGVSILDPDTTYIGPDVIIKEDVVIYPNNHIYGASVIDKNSVIYPGCWLENANIGQGVIIESSKVINSRVGEQTTIGPNAHLRAQTDIGKSCRIGNYVEIKNTVVGNNSSMAHLTYLGDAKVGKYVNIGCGVITANYDGKHKHQTKIGDHVSIGSNATLIAPVKIESHAVVAAGSTITDDVQEESLAIARVRQEVKKSYKKRENENER